MVRERSALTFRAWVARASTSASRTPSRRRTWRSWGRSLAIGLTVAALPACGPPQYGLVGVYLNESRQLTTVIGWCGANRPTSLGLSEVAPLPDRPVVHLTEVGHVTFPAPEGQIVEGSFEVPPADWVVSPQGLVSQIDPDRQYRLSSGSFVGVDFTLSRLRGHDDPERPILVLKTISKSTGGFISKAEFLRAVRDWTDC